MEDAMVDVQNRLFELTSTITFHTISVDQIEEFASKLSPAVGNVVPEYPAIVAFLIEPHPGTNDITYGLRFTAVDPDFVEDVANEVLQKAVDQVTESEGLESVEAEREESVLILTR